ncbi:MAG: hypothetical protein K2Z81_22570, partial [Cyanobacteria bacterium]|nr:hypothetical protein [Cyanobacteriota bacterium]
SKIDDWMKEAKEEGQISEKQWMSPACQSIVDVQSQTSSFLPRSTSLAVSLFSVWLQNLKS